MNSDNRRAWARFGAATIALVAAGAMAAPASAAEPAADLSIDLAGEKIARFAGKVFYVDIHNAGPAAAEGVKFSIDLSGINTAKLTIVPPTPDCETDDDVVYTCEVGPLNAQGRDGGFGLLAAALGKKGPAGALKLNVWSDTADPNHANDSKTVPITVEPRGLDLVSRAFDVFADADRNPVAPGGTGFLDMFFENNSSILRRSDGELVVKPVLIKGIEFTVNLPRYTTFAEHVAGCTYSNGDRTAECSDPDVILPPLLLGDEEHPSFVANSFEVKVATNAPGPVALTGGVVSGRGLGIAPPDDVPPALTARKAIGGLGTVKEKPDRDPKDNDAKFSVFAAANPADLAIAASSASGTVGSSVELTIAVENKGPGGSIDSFFTVKAPTGTELPAQELTAECDQVVAGKEYKCSDDVGAVFDAGEQFSVDITVKIVSATVGSDGVATVGSASPDPVAANNTAPLTITVTGGSGGGLPVTGVQVGVIGIVGVAVVALGGVMLLLSRRRRVVAVTPDDELPA